MSWIGRAGRVDPGHGLALADTPQREADRDARQPRSEGTVAAPARERPIGGHESLLGDVLGLMEVAEDPMAGPHDRRGFALDELAKGISVASEHGIDDGAVGAVMVWPGRGGWSKDRLAP